MSNGRSVAALQRIPGITQQRRFAYLGKRQRSLLALLAVSALLALVLAGCGGSESAVHFIEPPVAANGLNGLNGNSSQPTVAQPLPAFHPYAGHLPTAPTVSANEAFLLNPATNDIYLADNADEEVAMASTTKIMTAYVALTFGHLDQRITIGADANGALLHAEYDASVANLRPGDVLTLHDLLYGLMLPSGDDAAIAIADGIAGSQQNFVALMNLEAGLLDMRHTHYNDVHGLDAPHHYTTARDLARLATAAMQNPAFAQIVQTATYTLPATSDHGTYSWLTTNDLLITGQQLYYPGAIGIKTGYTGQAGGCLVFAAKRSYGELIGVVLGEQDPSDVLRFVDAETLLTWGFQIEQQLPASPSSGSSATPTATP